MKHLVLLLLLPGLIHAADILDGVAAIVNDKVITYSDVRSYVRPVERNLLLSYSGDELVQKRRAAQLDALENLIDLRLIIQEFEEKGYTMPGNIADTEIDSIIATDYRGNRTAFVKTLEAEHMTLSQYREKLRERIIVQAMTNRKLHQQPVVSPYKIEQFYQTHLDDYKMPDQIKLRMIFIKKTAPAAAEAAASSPATNATEIAAAPAEPPLDPRRKLAGEILAKLNEGDNFESLAKVYSEVPESKTGGDWGWISRRDFLDKPLSDVAFSLKTGQHSDLLETNAGYYILFVEAIQPAHTKPLDEVRADIEKQLEQNLRTKMRDDWVKQLRAKAYIRYF